jgi:hypothetical protein
LRVGTVSRRDLAEPHAGSASLRDDIFKPTVQYELRFEHGAVFVLGPRTNVQYYHSIPRSDGATPIGPRVSLTFRRALTLRDADGRLHGQGARYADLNWPTELQGVHRLDDDLEHAPAEGAVVHRTTVATLRRNPAASRRSSSASASSSAEPGVSVPLNT